MKDPVKYCEVHKTIGCCHVDSFLCDMENCRILEDYKKKQDIPFISNNQIEDDVF